MGDFIVLTIVIVAYGTKASFWYDKITNKYSVSPEDDDNIDNDTEEEWSNDSGDSNFLYSEYPENDYVHETEMQVRQLPDTGEAKSKKSQTWCKVKKVTRYLYEEGYEVFPKSYSEYDCIPHIKHDGFSDNTIYSHDVCPVHHDHCVALQKKHYFMKRKHSGQCWKLDVKAVRVGCKCIPSSPI